MDTTRITIPVMNEESVSAVLTVPPNGNTVKKTGIITAHGAGNDMENPLLVAFCDGLAMKGYPAMRFNFPYKEKGLKAPDGRKKLENTWVAVYRFFTGELALDVNHIIAAGKSMGGRVASHMVAEKTLPVDGIIFLGYPLHPPGDPTKIRDAHLYEITVPLLFFAGTRDPLCDLGRLDSVLSKLSAPWKREVIDGGNHSFHTPKSLGIRETDIFDRIVSTSAEWIETVIT